MLVIRQQQISVLLERAEENFVGRVMRLMRENLDAETYQLDDVELRRELKTGIEKARSHDLTWEAPIAAFVSLMFAIAQKKKSKS